MGSLRHVGRGGERFGHGEPSSGRCAEVGRRNEDGGEFDGDLVGYAYAGPYRTRPAYRFTVENSVYVAHDSHRRGVGKALLQALIEACTEKGFRLMVAVIGDSKQAASIGLHEAAGFKHAGVFENIGYKFDRWLDSVLMQRALGPGASKPR